MPKRLSAPKTPRQDELRAEIALCVSEIEALKRLLACPNPSTEHRAKLVSAVKRKDKYVADLKRCKNLVKA